MGTYRVRPIGRVRSSPYRVQGDAPRQGRLAPDEISEIEVFEPFRAGLGDFRGVTHLHVLLWFDRADRDSLVAHPPGVGRAVPVFCTRSPNRPNPIGLELAELRGIDRSNGILTVAGMDAFEGTPVLDVKPYIPSIDCVPGPAHLLAGRDGTEGPGAVRGERGA